MNHQDEFDRTMRAWFEDDAPRTAPRHLFDAVVAQTGSRRPRIGWRARLGATATPRAFSGIGPMGRLLILVAISAALLIGMIAGALLVGGPRPALLAVGPTPRPTTTPTPTTSPTPMEPPVATPSATPAGQLTAMLGAVPLEGIGSKVLLSGVRYTSSRFGLPIAFKLDAFGGLRVAGKGTDWCSYDSAAQGPYLRTSARTILLSWLMGCVHQVWFIRPASVDCGTLTPHPDAAALAAAIMANPGLATPRDLGAVTSKGVLPAALFLQAHQGRVIDVTRSRPFDPNAVNPDHCRLLPEPGSGDPAFEVRGDIASRLVLIDVNGELLVLLVAPAGYDATTGAAAKARGYDSGAPSMYGPLLSTIYDVKLGP
jgi:hypothetical protein